jgi:nucleotide-binding universal stress UspA family protein
MERTRWIVVGIDFSDGSLRALEFAMEHARTAGANIVCVHAYEDAPGTPAFHDPAQAIRDQLEDVIALRTPLSASLRVDLLVRRGAPWEKLANVATELGADLIVVGADGQWGASREGFLGTVAFRLVTTSPRPVVVVPSRPHVDDGSRPDRR